MAKFNKDSVSGTVTVVVLLSLVCSIVVSGAAVALKSKQDEQKADNTTHRHIAHFREHCIRRMPGGILIL